MYIMRNSCDQRLVTKEYIIHLNFMALYPQCLSDKTFNLNVVESCFKVTDNALNIEYYFWWRDDYFGLFIHHNAPFHFMVSISDEYKYKRLVKTTFKHEIDQAWYIYLQCG